MINIILIRKKTGRLINFNLPRSYMIALLIFFLGLPVATYFSALGAEDNQTMLADTNFSAAKLSNIRVIDEDTEALNTAQNKVNTITGSLYKDELNKQQRELDELKQYNQEMVQSLMVDLAKLQAHIIRLDSLGNRLTDVAKLDRKAFSFSSDVAIGGSADPDELTINSNYSHFEKRIEQITQEIHDRTKQFDILENLLLNEELTQTITPAGKPAEKGWVSSYFGMRKDPFSGKKRMHKGIDLAGKPGVNILATADGVVTRVEKQNGYGKVLDIDHGYGLSTRYGHNKEVLVKAGDLVKQGQAIAIMGSTGRSTGPHVHYEVLKNGNPVNPEKYIITARKN